ncbi:MAG: SDR family oxidoreductase [Deltaproteobacteria bacterium]|nr:SDR family oxidoreductase [Deltaproteobacteria bacterium]MBL7216343.1 SDR family oxidoreductase [Desulfobacteraceae bacterium]
MDLVGKTGIVTGAARGIGRGIALGLAEEGMNIVAVDLIKTQLDDLAKEVRGLGREILVVEGDVTSAESMDGMVQQAIRAFGQIHILVNNAGVVVVAPFTELKEEDWDKVIDVNLKGAFLCSKAVVPHMIEKKDGRIVNISSVAGKKAPPLIAAYSASKFGVIGLAQAMAQELGAHNITVNAVCPGFVDTAMWEEHLSPALSPVMGVEPNQVFETFTETNVPLQRAQSSGDIAQAVAFLCKADNISGVALNVDGGHTMV